MVKQKSLNHCEMKFNTTQSKSLIETGVQIKSTMNEKRQIELHYQCGCFTGIRMMRDRLY